MDKVSVIIPSYNEHTLNRTVQDAFYRADGDVEVIVVQDGPPFWEVTEHKNLTVVCREHRGLRRTINEAALRATGSYILKADAHCSFSDGYDSLLKYSCDVDWVVVPRCYGLDTEDWSLFSTDEVDYYYLSCPWTHPKEFRITSCPWISRTKKRLSSAPFVDEVMCLHGSFWFMHKSYWLNQLEGLWEEGFGDYGEHLEIGFKTWLGGGQVMVDKFHFYGHDHRTSNSARGYHRNVPAMMRSHVEQARFWTQDKWDKQIRTFDWLIDHFWPLPMKEDLVAGEKYYWPEDWRSLRTAPSNT